MDLIGPNTGITIGLVCTGVMFLVSAVWWAATITAKVNHIAELIEKKDAKEKEQDIRIGILERERAA